MQTNVLIFVVLVEMFSAIVPSRLVGILNQTLYLICAVELFFIPPSIPEDILYQFIL